MDASLTVVCDNVLENELEIGRAWPYRALGDGETHITASMLRSLGSFLWICLHVTISAIILPVCSTFDEQYYQICASNHQPDSLDFAPLMILDSCLFKYRASLQSCFVTRKSHGTFSYAFLGLKP